MEVDDQNSRQTAASTSGTTVGSRGSGPSRQSPRSAPRSTVVRGSAPRNVAKGGSGPASRTNRAPATVTVTSTVTAATVPTPTADSSRPVAIGVAGPSTSRQQPARNATAGRQVPGLSSARPSVPHPSTSAGPSRPSTSHDSSGLASVSATALVSSLATPATASRVPRHPRPRKNKSEHVPKSLRMCASSSMKKRLQPKRVILLRI